MIHTLARRIMNLVGRGRIQALDDSKNIQFIQAILGPLETQDNIPRLAEFGFTSSPPVGADVVVIFVNGNRSNRVAIATGDQKTRPKNLARGETMLYDSVGKMVYLSADGIIIDAKNTDVTVNNARNVVVHATTKITLDAPNVECTGDFKADGNVSDSVRSMAADRGKYDTHKHDTSTNPSGLPTVIE